MATNQLRWWVLGVATTVAVAGCATAKRQETAVQDLKAQVGVLESRVTAIDERQQTIEQKAWNQREDVAYLKGKTANTPTNVSITTMAQPDEDAVLTGGHRAGGKNRGYLYHRPKLSMSPKEIQLALKRAGYYTGHLDGHIGRRTKKAIRAFQSANGLRPDGIVGPQTWDKLQTYLLAKRR